MKNLYEWVSVKISNLDRFFLKCHEKNIAIYEIQRTNEELKIKKYMQKLQKKKRINTDKNDSLLVRG